MPLSSPPAMRMHGLPMASMAATVDCGVVLERSSK
jgi:hypothetical protein